MKKIIILSIALVLAVGMAGAAAWAFFTTSDFSDNEIYAGSLDLAGTVSGTGPSGKYSVTPGGNELNGSTAFSYLFPGESGSTTWVLVNNGTIPGTLVIDSTLTLTDTAQNEAELAVSGNDTSGTGDLGHCLGVTLQVGSGTDQAAAEAAFTYLLGSSSNYAALDELEAVLDSYTATMTAGNTVVFKLTWDLPLDITKAGTDGTFGTTDDIDVNENIIQGDNAEVDITFALNQ